MQDYSQRRGELSAFGRALNSSRSLASLIVMLGIVVMGISGFGLWYAASDGWSAPAVALAMVLIVVLAGLTIIWWFTRRHFIEPDLAFRMWLQQVCDGDLDARIKLPESHRHYKELNFHTRNLASALAQLSADMESLVGSQTLRLENQRRVLEMLLRLTDSISGETDKSAVLKSVAQHLANWFEQAGVAAYLVERDALRLVSSAVSDLQADSPTASFDSESAQAGTAHCSDTEVPYRLPTQNAVSEITWSTPENHENKERVRIPFFRGADVAGMFVIDIVNQRKINHSESALVLQSVSEQLTLFNNKVTAREQAERVRLISERTRLAGDMHDSLAQTLLAARYKATVLQETLAEAGSSKWSEDVKKIAGAIGEANQEIRELIREYRSPLADHRSVDSIQLAIEQFRETSGLQVFFQSENPLLRFTPREESVVQRIIGEALTNAEKYAEANTIRVFLQFLSDGTRTVLIEDDGQGFNVDAMIDSSRHTAVESGEHIGLSIMQERALGIGAIFSIDSEPGEGTRVSLRLPPLIEPEVV
ncbi:MAG: hypothetical protein KTR32_29415 [Granulosicoccus sp.]|nr:hypothetical protein [Granulosicoccus sp.]